MDPVMDHDGLRRGFPYLSQSRSKMATGLQPVEQQIIAPAGAGGRASGDPPEVIEEYWAEIGE
jgi:hypothetical protein